MKNNSNGKEPILNLNQFESNLQNNESDEKAKAMIIKTLFGMEVYGFVLELLDYLKYPSQIGSNYEKFITKYQELFTYDKILIYLSNRKYLFNDEDQKLLYISQIMIYVFEFILNSKPFTEPDFTIVLSPLLSLYRNSKNNKINSTSLRLALLQNYFFEKIYQNTRLSSVNLFSTILFPLTILVNKLFSQSTKYKRIYYNLLKSELFLLDNLDKNWERKYQEQPNFNHYKDVYQSLIKESKELQEFDDYSNYTFAYGMKTFSYIIKNKGLKYPFRIKYFLSNIPKLLTGYGEKPTYLLYLFFSVMFIFSIIYCWSGSFICNTYSTNGVRNSLTYFDYLYFSLTTMLTIGYGDITPNSTISKLVVMIQQIIGFISAGSFIALYLRKLYR